MALILFVLVTFCQIMLVRYDDINSIITLNREFTILGNVKTPLFPR